ncbi:Gfo/Idh/MocA family oxidoreductase [Clostridium perfringens]|nr:Gfo/Idh/MocA family oxidoreductase [Clostridium perfringens]
MRKISIAVIGAGSRGRFAYSSYALKYKEEVEIIAIAEPNEERRNLFVKEHGIKNEFVFNTWEDMLNRDRLADGIIIANNDEGHFEPTKIALEKGYNILLEKPMSNSLDEVIKLGELAKIYDDRVFMVCHVLRYTPFFEALKNIIDSGRLGRLINIQHNENIGYWHFAHSFTRGNWRNSDETSPLILAKSCHDMDILLWLTGAKCKSIASFGHLTYFKEENFKMNMGNRCLDCKVEKNCPYSAKKLYLGEKPVFTSVVHHNPTKENLEKALREGPYGRCVYRCDNNVVDHMVTILDFDNEVTATFNLSAFTKDIHRTIKLMFTEGEVGGNDIKNIIEIKKFGSDEIETIIPQKVEGGDLGGDIGIMRDFIKAIREENINTRTSALRSIESHIMAFAAEESRLTRCIVDIDRFFNLK